MTFEEFFHILDHMDALTDHDFRAVYSVIFIRALNRDLKRSKLDQGPPPGHPEDSRPPLADPG